MTPFDVLDGLCAEQSVEIFEDNNNWSLLNANI